MANQLSYVIKFVADMDRAVGFYRDTLGLALKFQSPGWSEFLTGETTLALHAADADHPAEARLAPSFSWASTLPGQSPALHFPMR